jgi:hypothetical protein
MIQQFLIFNLLLLSIYAYPQQNKNKIMINGNFNYNQSNLNNDFTSNQGGNYFEYIRNGKVNLNVGYFISNNFALGVKGSFERLVDRNNSEDASKTNFHRVTETQDLYASGLFARYHYMFWDDKLGILFQVSGTYDWGKELRHIITYNNMGTTHSFDEHIRISGFSTGFQPGAIYFINQRFSVETSIGNLSYSLQESKNKESRSHFIGSDFNANFSMSTLYFGLTYYFGGRKEVKSAE